MHQNLVLDKVEIEIENTRSGKKIIIRSRFS